MKFLNLLLVNLLLIIGFTSKSQSVSPLVSGWDMGVYMGYYLPSSYSAGFYNGNDNNENKLNFILNNTYQYNEIYNKLQASDTFFVTGMPTKMRYNNAFNIGIFFRRTFDKNFALNFQFNFSKLTASDFFQIEVDPYLILTEPDLRLFSIWGIEERVNIDILFTKYFKISSNHFIPFFEAGLNINSTRVKENKILIEDLEYSLVNVYLNGSYIPGVQQNQYDIRQGGVGFGLSTGGGVRMSFNRNMSIDPGLQFYVQKINLDGYERFKPAVVLYVRLSLSGFLSAHESE